MSGREIAAIIALMIAGFVAYAVISQFEGGDPDEVAPGETPEVAGGARQEPATGEMKAIVSAVLAADLHAAVSARHALPELPVRAGLLAVAGNPGELFFTRRYPDRTEVCVMRAAGVEVIWTMETQQILEIVGAHGSELLLKFAAEPFEGPADAWQPGGFYALDLLDPGMRISPADVDDEAVDLIQSTIPMPPCERSE